jgi:DNA-binding response OmpR family regulator
MRVLLLDEYTRRSAIVCEQLVKKNHELKCCYSSTDFMSALAEGAVDVVLLSHLAWSKGKSLYRYFDTSARLEQIPIILFDAPEGVTRLDSRPAHRQDRIIGKPSKADLIVEAFLSRE